MSKKKILLCIFDLDITIHNFILAFIIDIQI